MPTLRVNRSRCVAHIVATAPSPTDLHFLDGQLPQVAGTVVIMRTPGIRAALYGDDVDTPWQIAEQIAETHLNELGFYRVTRTNQGADGGLDVVGQGIAAQVKMLSAAVGSPDIQRLRGAAHQVEKVAFYAHRGSGYSRAAVRIADELGVALFTYELDGTVRSVNENAEELESPSRAVQRISVQADICGARLHAVQALTEPSMKPARERLAEIARLLAELTEQLPADASLDMIGEEHNSLIAEGNGLMQQLQAYPSAELSLVQESLDEVNQLIQAATGLPGDDLDELVHSPWRDALAQQVSAYHARLDELTAAVLPWADMSYGDSVEKLRTAAAKYARRKASRVTPEQVLEGWPALPQITVGV